MLFIKTVRENNLRGKEIQIADLKHVYYKSEENNSIFSILESRCKLRHHTPTKEYLYTHSGGKINYFLTIQGCKLIIVVDHCGPN